MNSTNMKTNSIETPWGRAETVVEVARGILRMSTMSHGGFFLAPEAQDKVPGYMRHPGDSFGAQRAAGWYEEDVDWSIVALVFPQFFPAEALDQARGILRAFRPAMLDRWDAAHGKAVVA